MKFGLNPSFSINSSCTLRFFDGFTLEYLTKKYDGKLSKKLAFVMGDEVGVVRGVVLVDAQAVCVSCISNGITNVESSGLVDAAAFRAFIDAVGVHLAGAFHLHVGRGVDIHAAAVVRAGVLCDRTVVHIERCGMHCLQSAAVPRRIAGDRTAVHVERTAQ